MLALRVLRDLRSQLGSRALEIVDPLLQLVLLPSFGLQFLESSSIFNELVTRLF